MPVKVTAARDASGFNRHAITINLLTIQVENTLGPNRHSAGVGTVVDAAVQAKAVALGVFVVEAESAPAVNVGDVLNLVACVGQVIGPRPARLASLQGPHLDRGACRLGDVAVDPGVPTAWIGVVAVPTERQRAPRPSSADIDVREHEAVGRVEIDVARGIDQAGEIHARDRRGPIVAAVHPCFGSRGDDGARTLCDAPAHKEHIAGGRCDVTIAQHQRAVAGHKGHRRGGHVARQGHARGAALSAHVQAAAHDKITQLIDHVLRARDRDRRSGCGRQGLDIDLVIAPPGDGLGQRPVDGVARCNPHRHVRESRSARDRLDRLEAVGGGDSGPTRRPGDLLGHDIAGGVGTHDREGHSRVVAAHRAGQRQRLSGTQTQVVPQQGERAAARLCGAQRVDARHDTHLERALLGFNRTHGHPGGVVDQHGWRAIAGGFVVGGDDPAADVDPGATAIDADLSGSGVQHIVRRRLTDAVAGQVDVTAAGGDAGVVVQRERTAACLQAHISTGGGQVPINGEGTVGGFNAQRRSRIREHHVRAQGDAFITAIVVGGACGPDIQAQGSVVVLGIVGVAQIDATGVVDRRQAGRGDGVSDAEVGTRCNVDVAQLSAGRGAISPQETARIHRAAVAAGEAQIVAFVGLAEDVGPKGDRTGSTLERDVVVQVEVTGAHRRRAVPGLGVDGDRS